MMGPKDKHVFTVIYMNTGTDDCPEWTPIERIIEKSFCRFPEYFGQKNTTGTDWYSKPVKRSTCFVGGCPFVTGDEDAWCPLTGDLDGENKHKCPFYGGADTVNYEDF